jgi:hypothetical protein
VAIAFAYLAEPMVVPLVGHGRPRTDDVPVAEQ